MQCVEKLSYCYLSLIWILKSYCGRNLIEFWQLCINRSAPLSLNRFYDLSTPFIRKGVDREWKKRKYWPLTLLPLDRLTATTTKFGSSHEMNTFDLSLVVTTPIKPHHNFNFVFSWVWHENDNAHKHLSIWNLPDSQLKW